MAKKHRQPNSKSKFKKNKTISQAQKPQLAHSRMKRKVETKHKSNLKIAHRFGEKVLKPQKKIRLNKGCKKSKTKQNTYWNNIISLLKFGNILSSDFSSVQDMLFFPLRLLFKRPWVKVKYK